MDVRDLRTEAAALRLEKILKGLAHIVHDQDEEIVYTILENLESSLDDFDGHDAFGTEGWRHTFLGESH